MFFNVPVAFGQFSATQNIQVVTIPQNPRPNEDVTVSVAGGTIDLNSASFTWYEDGKLIRDGSDRFVRILAPTLGETKEVTVIVEFPGGKLESTVNLIPTAVEILWQAKSIVPPFYSGKALLPSDGNITLYADPYLVLPTGEKLRSQDLTFVWKKNTYTDTQASGKGRNTYTFRVPAVQDLVRPIVLEVSSPKYNLQASAQFLPVLADSEILYYQRSPLLGLLLNRSVGDSLTMDRDEITLAAMPYNFSKINGDINSLSFKWAINDQSVGYTDESPALLTIRRPSDAGRSFVSTQIDHSANNATRLLQKVFTGIEILYGGLENPNF